MARFNSTVQRASITATASGDTAVVAAVTSKRICVIRLMLTSDADVSVRFRSGTTPVTGPIPVGARSGWRDGMARSADDPDDSLFETAVGEALNVNLSGAANVGGYLAYYTR
jgi:hypothetical protein